MAHETIHTLVVGAGQAGVAMSEHLSAQGIEHLGSSVTGSPSGGVQSGGYLGGKWPAWHDRFPSWSLLASILMPSQKRNGCGLFRKLCAHIKAPIRCGVTVTKVTLVLRVPVFWLKQTKAP